MERRFHLLLPPSPRWCRADGKIIRNGQSGENDGAGSKHSCVLRCHHPLRSELRHRPLSRFHSRRHQHFSSEFNITMACIAESILWWTGVVYYYFKIFPSYSRTSMQFTFQKTIPFTKWGEGDFFLPPLLGSSML